MQTLLRRFFHLHNKNNQTNIIHEGENNKSTSFFQKQTTKKGRGLFNPSEIQGLTGRERWRIPDLFIRRIYLLISLKIDIFCIFLILNTNPAEGSIHVYDLIITILNHTLIKNK